MANGRELLFGERAEDVKLSDARLDPQRQRQRLAERLRRRQEDPTAGQRVIEGGERLLGTLGRRIESGVAGRRGAGRLLAERGGRAALAQAGAEIAGETAGRAAEADAAEVERAERLDIALQAAIEAGQISIEQAQAERAKPGILAALLTAGGAAIGGITAGGKGAQTGGQIGFQTGRLASTLLR